jgi:hypothetical protein
VPSGQPQGNAAGEQPGTESNTARRRRRRRRGRRGGRGRTPGENAETLGAGTDSATEISSPADSATPPHGDPTREVALDEDDGDDEAEEFRSTRADDGVVDFDGPGEAGGESGEDEGPDSTQ